MASLLHVACIVPGSLVPGTGGRCWRAERLLGTGTCCTVWRAQLDGRPDQQVALKVYRSGNSYSAACEREIMLLDLVMKVKGKSPYLVEVLDNFRYKGHACVVETCLEASLRNIVTKNLQQPLSMSLVKTLLKHLLSGLLILHQVGFVHGDLKPSNLLWNPQDGVLTIIDFGLSFHVLDKKIGQVQTPNYRAPECHDWNKRQREQEVSTQKKTPPNHAVTSSLTPSTTSLPNPLLHPTPGLIAPPPLPPSMWPPFPTDSTMNAFTGNGNTGQFPAFLVGGVAMGLAGGGGERPVISESSDVMVTNSLYSIHHQTAPVEIEKPGPSADVWSVGIIIMDMVIGGRFIPTNNQIPTAEIRAGVREALLQRRDESNSGTERQDWMLLLDLCQRIFFDDPECRLTTEQIMKHDFFDRKLNLSHRDLCLLPTCVLRLVNVFEDKVYSTQEEQEILDDVLEECVRHGPVVTVTLSKHAARKVYIEFASWTTAIAAWEAVIKLRFDGHKLQATFFLKEDFITGNHY